MKTFPISRLLVVSAFFVLILSGCRNNAPTLSHNQISDTISVVHGDNLELRFSFTDDRDELMTASVIFGGNEKYRGSDTTFMMEVKSGSLRARYYPVKVTAEDMDSLKSQMDLAIIVVPVKPVGGSFIVDNVRATTARVNIPVISDGGQDIIEMGVLWSKDGEPDASSPRILVERSTEDFSIVDGFPRNTNLFLRGYLVNKTGLTMTNSVEIKTMTGIPKVVSGDISETHSTSVKASGKVLTDGGEEIRRYGIVYSTEKNPTVNDKLSRAAGSYSYTTRLTDLIPFTKYYFRSFVANRFATVYGEMGEFETTGPPSVITGDPGRILIYGINMTIDVTSDGGHEVTESGIVYSFLKNPTIDTNKRIIGKGIGKQSGLIGNLEPGASYRLRAYAINSEGVSYGEELLVFTKIGIPEVKTLHVSDIDIFSAVISGIISDDGGLDVIERGIAWDTLPGPTKSNNYSEVGGGEPDFRYKITGLNTGVKYYARAYARNERGYVYADPVAFVPLIPIDLIEIEGGTFIMGADDEDESAMPSHQVTISPFRMSQFEVSNSEFFRFLNANLHRISFEGNEEVVLVDGIPVYYLKVFGKDYEKSEFRVHIAYRDGKFEVENDCEEFPAILVSWEGARLFCEWAGGRLPTEAEWEYAARGGSESAIYAGGNELERLGWFSRNSKDADCELAGDSRGIFKVGQKRPNPFGLYDLSGNAAEWCNDIYSDDYYEISPVDNPTGPEKGTYRVIRGGSWIDGEEMCRIYARLKSFDNTRGYDNIAFRLVRPTQNQPD